jgi:hypothetical protein
MTSDELFVSADAANGGVPIANRSATENLVMLKHFGPGNPQAPGRPRPVKRFLLCAAALLTAACGDGVRVVGARLRAGFADRHLAVAQTADVRGPEPDTSRGATDMAT